MKNNRKRATQRVNIKFRGKAKRVRDRNSDKVLFLLRGKKIPLPAHLNNYSFKTLTFDCVIMRQVCKPSL